MRQGVLLSLLCVVLTVFALCANAQDSRLSNDDRNNLTITEKPEFSDVFVQDLYDKIEIGFTCTHNENSLKNYLFSEEDVKGFVRSYQNHPGSDKSISLEAATNRIAGLVDLARHTIEEVGIADQVTLVNHDPFYSDEEKTYRGIKYVVEAMDKAGMPHNMEILMVEYKGEFKLLAINNQDN